MGSTSTLRLYRNKDKNTGFYSSGRGTRSEERDETDPLGLTAMADLYAAADAGDAREVGRLLEAQADVSFRSPDLREGVRVLCCCFVDVPHPECRSHH